MGPSKKRKIMNNEMRVALDIAPNKFKRFARKMKWLFGVYLKPGHDTEVLTRNGLLKFYSKDKTTGRILHIFRHHEFDEIQRVVDKLKELGKIDGSGQGVVIDVGGYIGMSSTAFLLENLFEKSYAFEASPYNFKYLQENIKLNNLGARLNAFNMAMSDSEGELELELSDSNHGDNRIRNKSTAVKNEFNEHERKTVKIPAKKFDDFLKEHSELNPSEIKLIWMDIQGHEPLFISGAKEFIKSHPEVPICMEFWPYAMKRSGVDVDGFLNFLKENYQYFIDLGPDMQLYETKDLKARHDELWKISQETNEPSYGANIMVYNP